MRTTHADGTVETQPAKSLKAGSRVVKRAQEAQRRRNDREAIEAWRRTRI